MPKPRSALIVIAIIVSYFALDFVAMLIPFMFLLPTVLYFLFVPAVNIIVSGLHCRSRKKSVFAASVGDLYPLGGMIVFTGFCLLNSLFEGNPNDYGLGEAVGQVMIALSLIHLAIFAAYLVVKYVIVFVKRKRKG